MSSAIGEFRDIAICSVPYRMLIVDGGVLFSQKSGFYGSSERFMFEYRHYLWYLVQSEAGRRGVAACHLSAMHEKLCEYVCPDNAEADGEFALSFKK